jgi:hypothetical protein
MGRLGVYAMQIVNQTSLAAGCHVLMDQHHRQFVVVVVSAAFEIRPGTAPRLADELPPIRAADVYYGEPGLSSVRYEADLALEKPAVDILVNGRAVAPGGRKAEKIRVSVAVGGWRKELLVTGDRHWRLGSIPSSPEPFETIPIVYERAFGGIDKRPSNLAKHYSDPRNPIGIGFQGAASPDPTIQSAVPNVEYSSGQMSSILDRPAPAGFGVVARNWQPRVRFAGTYDDAWKAQQCPQLPLDFDARFYQAAPADQQISLVQGGEPVETINLTPEGTWRFTLPTLDVPVCLRYSDRRESASLRIDTVLLEPDSYRLTLTARARIPILRNRAPMKEIILGRSSPAWWRARLQYKAFVDRARRGGRTLAAKDFHL